MNLQQKTELASELIANAERQRKDAEATAAHYIGLANAALKPSTPTPRTDAAWASSFEPCEYRAAHTARTMRDECAKLERELATERARLRIVEEFMLRGHIPQAEDDYPQIWLGNGYFDTLADAADAAMKEEIK